MFFAFLGSFRNQYFHLELHRSLSCYFSHNLSIISRDLCTLLCLPGVCTVLIKALHFDLMPLTIILISLSVKKAVIHFSIDLPGSSIFSVVHINLW